MKQKKRWVFIIPVLILAMIVAAWYFFVSKPEIAVSTDITQRTAIVERGNLNVTLSGSGSVYPTISTEIKVGVDGTVKENYMEEGKMVKAGDVLITLNKYDNEISERKLESSLEQKKLSYQQQLDDYEALTVKAPVQGKITSIMVEEGEKINSGKELLSIRDETILYAQVTFKDAIVSNIDTKEQVIVHLPEYMTTMTGEIIAILQNGKNVEVEVLVQNLGELKEEIEVWCELSYENSMISSSIGSLRWYTQRTVYSETSGTVQTIHVNKGGYVDGETVLITLNNEESAINLNNALIQVEEAEYNIEEFKIDADKYIITAPMDGYLTSVKELLQEDSLKDGDSIASLINIDEMEFEISVDELDINQVSIGQKVSVTVEAIEETAQKPIAGKVTNIALEGYNSNGVTSYPVTVTVPGQEGLKVGMNVDGEIQVVNKEDVLLVPLEALQKIGDSYMVWLKTEDSQSNTENYQMTDFAPPEGNFGDSDSIPSGMQSEIQDRTGLEIPSEMQGREGANWSSRMQESTDTDDIPESETQSSKRTELRNDIANSYYDGAIMVRVETGQYNENYMEIVSGLEEGDVVVLPIQVSNADSATTSQEQGMQIPEGMNMPMGGGPSDSFGGMPGGGRP